ncbi:hypothetical protein AB0D66_20730 [Streptomyces sp. NPDC048270]|uniref:hypothetical protein n=1 Tax=Streptomyces sp. NPDC048270 TaxID=3154615 RepID=UPI0033E4F9F0
MSELMTPALAGAAAGLGVAMPMGAMSVLLLQEAMRHRRTAVAAALGIAVVDLGYAALATALGPWVAAHVSPVEAWVRLASALILLAIAAQGLTQSHRRPKPADPDAPPPRLTAPHAATPTLEARGPGHDPSPSASEARGPGHDPSPPAPEARGARHNPSPPAPESRGPRHNPAPPAPEARGPRHNPAPPAPESRGPRHNPAPPAPESRGPGHNPAPPAFEARGPGRSPETAPPALGPQIPEPRPCPAPPASEARGAGRSAGARGSAGAASRPGKAFARYVGLTAINPTTALYFAALTTAQGATLGSGAAGAAFLVGVGAASLLWQQALVALGALAGSRISDTARAWTFRLGYGLVAAYAVKIALPLP